MHPALLHTLRLCQFQRAPVLVMHLCRPERIDRSRTRPMPGLVVRPRRVSRNVAIARCGTSSATEHQRNDTTCSHFIFQLIKMNRGMHVSCVRWTATAGGPSASHSKTHVLAKRTKHSALLTMVTRATILVLTRSSQLFVCFLRCIMPGTGSNLAFEKLNGCVRFPFAFFDCVLLI